METQICGHFMYGYCKFKETCMKKHVKGECQALSACTSKVCLKRHPKVCKRFFMENFCKFGPQCAYKHIINKSSDVQKHPSTLVIEESPSNLKIKLLEEEVKVLNSQILQLGCLARELSDKVDLVTNIQLTRNPVTEEPQEKEKINNKNKEVINLKFKCDQCNCTFKKQITLKKHKNTKHSQPQKKLGVGQFGYVFDVRPGKQDKAKALREEWRNDDVEAQILSRAKSSSLSSIEEDDDNDDSEEDEAFFAKYDDDGNFIG